MAEIIDSLRGADAIPPTKQGIPRRELRKRLVITEKCFARAPPGSLRNPRLNGGACSRSRTRLSAEFPDLQGKYREITESGHPGVGRSAVPGPFLGPMESISLNLETGKFLPTSRESRDANCESCS